MLLEKGLTLPEENSLGHLSDHFDIFALAEAHQPVGGVVLMR